MTKRTIILFDSMHEPLGECSVEGGVCSSVRLNALGERLVERVIEKLSSHTLQRMLSFTEALREWADHTGYLLVSFPSDRIVLWQEIASMPISPADRYAIAFAISHSSRHQQDVWQEALRTFEPCQNGRLKKKS